MEPDYVVYLKQGLSSQGTIVRFANGDEIPNVTAVDIQLRPSKALWVKIIAWSPENPLLRIFLEGTCAVEVDA